MMTQIDNNISTKDFACDSRFSQVKYYRDCFWGYCPLLSFLASALVLDTAGVSETLAKEGRCSKRHDILKTRQVKCLFTGEQINNVTGISMYAIIPQVPLLRCVFHI